MRWSLAWATAERVIRRAIESDAGPPYVSVFVTRHKDATAPAGFKKSKYPGLIFLNFARNRSPGNPHVVAYWKNEAAFTAGHVALVADLSLGDPVTAGVVSEMQLGQKTILQHLRSFSLKEALIGAAAIIGAYVVVQDFALYQVWKFLAAPQADLYAVNSVLDVAAGTAVSIPLKIRSGVHTRELELTTDSLRLEITPGQSISLSVEGERPPRVPPSQTVDFTLKSNTVIAKMNESDPRPDRLQLKGALLARAGMLRSALRKDMPPVGVRIWSSLGCDLVPQRADQDDKSSDFRTLTGRIYSGRKHEQVTVFVVIKGAAGLDLSAREGNRDFAQESSQDGSVKVIEWETGPLEAFQSRDFTLFVRSKNLVSAERWRKVRTDTTIACQ